MEDNHEQQGKIQRLLMQLQDAAPEHRINACKQLELISPLPEYAVEILRKTVEDPNRQVAEAAQWALITNPSTKDAYSNYLTATASMLAWEEPLSLPRPGEKPIHPWFKIWIKPRETIREIIDYDPSYLVIPLAIITGVAEILYRAMDRNLGDSYELVILIIFILIGGPLLGLASIYLGGTLFSWVGKFLGGKGSPQEVRAALAWSSISWIFILFIALSRLAIFGSEEFTTPTPRLDMLFENASRWELLLLLLYSATTPLIMMIFLWSFMLTLKCLAEAHRFSAWMSIATILISFTVILLVVLLLMVPTLIR